MDFKNFFSAPLKRYSWKRSFFWKCTPVARSREGLVTGCRLLLQLLHSLRRLLPNPFNLSDTINWTFLFSFSPTTSEDFIWNDSWLGRVIWTSVKTKSQDNFVSFGIIVYKFCFKNNFFSRVFVRGKSRNLAHNVLWYERNTAGNYMFKVNDKNTRTKCKICSKFWCFYC